MMLKIKKCKKNVNKIFVEIEVEKIAKINFGL